MRKACGENRSVSIEGIALEHFSELPKADINSTTTSRQRHAGFFLNLIIANKMLPLIMHKSIILFHCLNTGKYLQHH